MLASTSTPSVSGASPSPPLSPMQPAHAGLPAVVALSGPARCAHGRLFKRVRLKKVSAHLESPSVREDVGTATAAALGHVIAVGTSRGSILLFDFNQALRGTLGNAAFGVENGAVTAIALLATTGEFLAAGYETGAVALWDLSSGRLAKVVRDAHENAGPITAVEFGDLHGQVIVASDARGSVFIHTFRKLVGVAMCDSRLLLNGHKAPVVAMSALVPRLPSLSTQGGPPAHHSPAPVPSAMFSACMFAFAMADKILIVRMQPKIEIVHTIARIAGDVFDASPPSTGGHVTAVVPCVSWGVAMNTDATSLASVPSPHKSDGSDDRTTLGRVLLAYSWSAKLRLLQVSCDVGSDAESASRFEFAHRASFDCTSGSIMAAEWLGPYAVALLDQFESIVLVDPHSAEQLDRSDVADIGLAYRPVHIGGARGKIERIYRSAVSSFKGRVMLLGISSCHVATVASWQERISSLVSEGLFLEALSLALAMYDGRARAVIGLPSDAGARRRIVGRQITDLLVAYVDISIAAHTAVAEAAPKRDDRGGAHGNTTFYASLAAVCLDYCLVLDMMEVLFGDIYERFGAEPVAMGAFLETLEPHILADRVQRLTPVIMKDLVAYYSSRGWLSRVEQCILHLDPAGLDLHDAVTLSIRHNLHSAFIYVHNRAMRDYVTPLGHLLGMVVAQVSRRAVDGAVVNSNIQTVVSNDQTPRQIDLESSGGDRRMSRDDASDASVGYKLLLYISLCLTGRAYPGGAIPPESAESVKADVYGFLLARYDTALGYTAKIKTKAGESGIRGGSREKGPSYPHLRILLEFDAREFLNVLSLAFEDPLLDYPMKRTRSLGRLIEPASPAESSPPRGGSRSKASEASPRTERVRQPGRMAVSASALPDVPPDNDATVVVSALPDRQLIVDILLDVVRSDYGHASAGELSSRLGSAAPGSVKARSLDIESAFFVFLARHLSRHSEHVRVGRDVFESMLEVLMLPNDRRFTAKRDNLPNSAASAVGLPSEPLNSGTPSAHPVGVTHSERQEAVLELYHAGALRHMDEERLLLTAEAAGFFQVVELVYARRGQHARILSCYIRDSARCSRSFAYAHRVATDMNAYSDRDRADIREIVRASVRDLAAIDARAAARLFVVDFADDIPAAINEGLAGAGESARLRFEFLRGIFEPRQLSRGPRQLVPPSAESFHEEYIALMCALAPHQVYVYLRDHEGYRLEACLDTCKAHSVTDAQAWILERMGDIASAFALMLDALTAVLREYVFHARDQDGEDETGMSKVSKRPFVVLDAAIGLCKRNSPHMDEIERDDMWFSLLGAVVEILREARMGTGACESVLGDLSAMTRTILNGMTGHVSLKTILQRVLADETGYGMHTLGDVRDIVAGMLDTIRYEETLLSTTNRIVTHDRFAAVVNLRASKAKGVSPEHPACEHCTASGISRIKDRNGPLAIFVCGHAFHTSCLGAQKKHCPICHARARTLNIMNREPSKSAKGKERATVQDDDLASAMEGGPSSLRAKIAADSAAAAISSATSSATAIEKQRIDALDRYMRALSAQPRVSLELPVSSDSGWSARSRRDISELSDRRFRSKPRSAAIAMRLGAD